MMANMNNFHGLGAPGAGFASRGKTNRPSRLSLASPPRVDSISENPADGLPQPPRTSRSHLLAGLRTQPKTPGPVPASAPYNKTSHGMQNYQLSNQYQHQQANTGYGNVPHTAIGSNFPMHQQQYYQAGQQHYTLPEQEIEQEQMDQQTLEKLALQEQRLALQAQYLQYQMAALNMGGQNVLYPQTPATPQQMPMFNQQQLSNQGIVTQEIPGQPGMYLATNLMTGQSQILYDTSIQQTELSNSPPPPTPGRLNTKFASEQSRDTGSPYSARSRSPPKKTATPPVDVQPLPPPSANAFRRGTHNRNRSSLVLNNTNGAQVTEGPKSALPRTTGIPGTPMTGTFGPGHGRAGEHPIRQPMGPPSIDELKKAPTTKCEGSKNFVARTRRNALSKLVKAGRERRTVRPGSGNGSGSAGSLTPVSDAEITFSVPSDNDSDSGRSLSGRRSFGSMRAAASGAIGSERKLRKSSQESIGGSRSGTPIEEKLKRVNVLSGLGTQA